MRLRTSSPARRFDSPSNRSASSAERPIVLPSRIPETESDSWTSEEMSAIDSCRTVAISRRCAADPARHPARRAASAPSAKSASCQSSRNIAMTVAITVVTVDMTEVAVEVRTLSTPPMSLRDPALHLAGARLREEREREPLQVAVDRGAQVVHHALADLRREVRLDDAEDAGDERDRDHPGDEHAQQAQVDCRRPVARRSDRRVEDLPQQERRDDPEARGDDDQAAMTSASFAQYGRKSRADPAQVGPAHGLVGRALDAARAA